MDALAVGDPARIGPFRLVARLGRGGMGLVYLGRAESTGRAVAVKTIHGELLADPEFRARFTHEVAAARRVRDEYIAEVVDADPSGSTPWLATVYVPGISVEDAVRRFGPLPADSVRVLGICVARAVAAIHAVGLVHRDLKPGNVLLTASGPKVIDFGIARGLADERLTQTGMVSGSPPYMAPEQLNSGDFGPGSDVFSLASILHYAATGAGPYGRGGAQEQYARALAVGPLLDPELPANLTKILGRALTTDPEPRPTAAQLAEALEDYSGERPNAGWLPSVVMQEILVQATAALNTASADFRPPQPPSQPQNQPYRPPTPQQPLYQPPDRQQWSSQPGPARVPTPPGMFAPPTNSTPPRPAGRASPFQQQSPKYHPPYQTPIVQVGPYSYQTSATRNPMAVASLVLSLTGIIVPCLLPLGLVFGIIGLGKARTGRPGRGLAMAGAIISTLLTIGWIAFITWAANSTG
jgi:serine/threonine protein kinase